MQRAKVGVIGCGRISGIYLQNCTRTFDILEVVACADRHPELARKRAEEFGVRHACTIEELLANPEIEIVLNLTPPEAHTEVNRRILSAGKHVYTEKPLALTREEADSVIELAGANRLRVGAAPDTFLGGGLQTCRKLIDEGAIGTVYGASGLILLGNLYDGTRPGVEKYLRLGWDPVFDLAPYYLTAMVFLLGRVSRVSGAISRVPRDVLITNPQSPRYGETIELTVPMNGAATLEFAGGAIATLQAAKESFGYTPRFEIYGTEGILYAPDPNMFGEAIRIRRRDGSLEEITLSHGFTENSRGIGVADMAYAIRAGRPHRASGELAGHVLDVTLGVFESSRAGRHILMTSQCERPEPLPPGSSVEQPQAWSSAHSSD